VKIKACSAWINISNPVKTIVTMKETTDPKYPITETKPTKFVRFNRYQAETVKTVISKLE